jgi:hypothetical protein
MQIDDEQSRRLSASLESLSERIARLAIGLGLRLDDQQTVQNLLEQPQIPQIEKERRRAMPVDGKGHVTAMTGERRTAHLREELRGLLVLRYHFETVLLNDNGLSSTRQVIEQAEAHLLQRGFKPGAHGLDLDNFFNAK